MARNDPRMTDRASESHDSLNDDSWFDAPPGGRRRGITRAEVFAALEKAGLEADPAAAPQAWAGLDDSWFDRPRRR